MKTLIKIALGVLMLAALAFVFRLVSEARKSRAATAELGVTEGRLSACPDRPNCVSSDAGAREHQIEAIADPSDAAWARLSQILGESDGATIVSQDDSYLHATFESALFGFVDDLELHRRPGEIAVRSASRVGYSDMGANRRRVELIREQLATR